MQQTGEYERRKPIDVAAVLEEHNGEQCRKRNGYGGLKVNLLDAVEPLFPGKENKDRVQQGRGQSQLPSLPIPEPIFQNEEESDVTENAENSQQWDNLLEKRVVGIESNLTHHSRISERYVGILQVGRAKNQKRDPGLKLPQQTVFPERLCYPIHYVKAK